MKTDLNTDNDIALRRGASAVYKQEKDKKNLEKHSYQMQKQNKLL